MASSLRIHLQRLGEPLSAVGSRLRRLSGDLACRLAGAGRRGRAAVLRAGLLVAANVDPVWVLFFYFVLNSFAGFVLLKISGRKETRSPAIGNLDIFFTAVSAATVSSMSTVEMESLSMGQLAVVGLLMLVGGEVFTSLIPLQLTKANLLREAAAADVSLGTTTAVALVPGEDGGCQLVELASVAASPPRDVEAADDKVVVDSADWELKYRSANLLGMVVLWYNAVFVLLGSISVLLYIQFVSASFSGGGAREVLRKKGIHTMGFSVFVSISSFTNGGFIPTNEGMQLFRRNSFLLVLITPLLLAGNTLFPACLMAVLGTLKRLPGERALLLDYLLGRPDGRAPLGFCHLLSKTRCAHLVLTAAAFLAVQFTLFCCMEWNSDALVGGMSAYEKAVAVIFQSVNSRHAGESVFDLSATSPAILVLYVVMMYLPPYTSFSPSEEEPPARKRIPAGPAQLPRNIVLSQISYIAIFVILVCVSERRKLAEDPLNFSLLNIAVEVVSAYGNVGFSTGYSCGRRTRPDEGCKDRSYGFAGRWSGTGKLILVAVMLTGRLKKYNERGGGAWKLN